MAYNLIPGGGVQGSTDRMRMDAIRATRNGTNKPTLAFRLRDPREFVKAPYGLQDLYICAPTRGRVLSPPSLGPDPGPTRVG